MITDFPFHALQHFLVVAREQNYTRAAEELHLSQPALSRSIQKLEERLGCLLLERKPRRVMLTEAGEVLLTRGKEILQLVEEALAELNDAGRRGRIRLGAIPTIAPYYLPAVLGPFAKRHPEIAVVV
ncbi:MAG: LysR family transcriptional regulator [Verrucomicrobiales bacterium]|nr:LysR family transcriptional regulator [Verrucomicrobiales bacterium]